MLLINYDQITNFTTENQNLVKMSNIVSDRSVPMLTQSWYNGTVQHLSGILHSIIMTLLFT